MKGYKAFDKNLVCRDMQYEIGKEYIFDGDPIPCKQGYHFCKSIADCYKFYNMSENTRICEISATGAVETDDEIKYCTNKIKIIREIKNPREKSNTSKTSSGYCNSGNRNSGYRNSGDWNSGDCNSGNRNSGDWNSGNRNSGYRNSGNRNSGDWNSGYCNSGNRNSGNWNSGDWNSGDCNSGYRNSGDWNSGDWNSGLFNTDKNPKIKIFDIESEWTMNEWHNSLAYQVMIRCPNTHSEFISLENMTEEEKANHPEYKTIGGYIKTFIITNAERQVWWNNLSDENKQAVYSIPNFDADKFEMCTGIKPF